MNELEGQYLNRVRVFAIMMIVLLHVSAPVRDQWHAMATANWFVSAIFDSFGRAGVPLFVMISGALLLPKKEDWVFFYKKRFSRILLPMFFWSFIFALLWQWQLGENKSIIQLILKIFAGPTYYHLWYFYMLFGIYIATPFFRVLVQNLAKKQVELLLLIWIVFRFILPGAAGQFHIWFNFDFSIGIQQNFPDLYIGYFILGYYLHVYGMALKLKKLGQWFFIISVFQAFASAAIYNKVGTYQELIIMPYSITVLLQATIFFLWIKNRQKYSMPHWMQSISNASFGIYLIHPLLIEGMRIGIGKYHLNAKISDTLFSIPITWLTTFLLSFALIALLLKIPYLKKIVS